MEVERSFPPYPLRDFKQKWSKELQLMKQALSLAIQSLEESNITLLREADDLIFESNNLKTEYSNDLLDLLNEYDIDISAFSP